ncbi:MAG: MGMT family protein [Bacteroidales bacterium]
MDLKTERKDFFELVYELVKCIPEGRVSSYGAIAKALGVGQSSRMVGQALKNSAGDSAIPAHRVVNRMGILTGRHSFSPPERMEQKLASEGVEVKDDRVVRFKELFWDPMQIVEN